MHFPSQAALHAAAAEGVALGWPDGQLLTSADEADVAVQRVFRRALGHGRTVQIGAVRTVLTGNSNKVWATVGMPDVSVGVNGDLALDTTGATYQKSAGAWAVSDTGVPSPMLTPVTLAENSIWGQWVEQVLLMATEYILVGLAGTGGEKRVARISRAGLVSTVLTVPGGTFETDDHDVLGATLLPDGRALTGFSRHSVVGTASVYYRISVDNTATSWGTLQQLATSPQPSYMQLWTVGSRVFMFYRVGNSASGYWVMRWSDNNAATWTAEVQVTPVAYLGTKAEGTIISCAMYGHPVTSTDKKVYVFTIDTTTGDVRSNGTVIGNINSPPQDGEGNRLPLATTSNTRVAIQPPSMVRMFASGADYILGCEFPGAGSVGTYCWYQRVGETGLYERRVICSAGRPFKAADNAYFNGLCIAGPNMVIASVSEASVAGVGPSRLERWVAPDASSPFSLDKVLLTSANTLARPQCTAAAGDWAWLVFYSRLLSYAAYTSFASTQEYAVLD